LEAFDKPVAFLHGDTHLFRIDKPLYSKKTNRLFENFTRIETFGWPDTHWVRITVDPADPQLFRFKAEIVPENVTGCPRLQLFRIDNRRLRRRRFASPVWGYSTAAVRGGG